MYAYMHILQYTHHVWHHRIHMNWIHTNLYLSRLLHLTTLSLSLYLYIYIYLYILYIYDLHLRIPCCGGAPPACHCLWSPRCWSKVRCPPPQRPRLPWHRWPRRRRARRPGRRWRRQREAWRKVAAWGFGGFWGHEIWKKMAWKWAMNLARIGLNAWKMTLIEEEFFIFISTWRFTGKQNLVFMDLIVKLRSTHRNPWLSLIDPPYQYQVHLQDRAGTSCCVVNQYTHFLSIISLSAFGICFLMCSPSFLVVLFSH